jgi:hypothetical protein
VLAVLAVEPAAPQEQMARAHSWAAPVVEEVAQARALDLPGLMEDQVVAEVRLRVAAAWKAAILVMARRCATPATEAHFKAAAAAQPITAPPVQRRSLLETGAPEAEPVVAVVVAPAQRGAIRLALAEPAAQAMRGSTPGDQHEIRSHRKRHGHQHCSCRF